MISCHFEENFFPQHWGTPPPFQSGSRHEALLKYFIERFFCKNKASSRSSLGKKSLPSPGISASWVSAGLPCFTDGLLAPDPSPLRAHQMQQVEKKARQILKFWLQWKKKDPVLFYHRFFIQETPPQSLLFTHSYSKAKLWRFRGNLASTVKPSSPP